MSSDVARVAYFSHCYFLHMCPFCILTVLTFSYLTFVVQQIYLSTKDTQFNNFNFMNHTVVLNTSHLMSTNFTFCDMCLERRICFTFVQCASSHFFSSVLAHVSLSIVHMG